MSCDEEPSLRRDFERRGDFILARDEWSRGYEGPAWVPFNLHSVAGACGGTREERECARRLISARGAETLWSAIGSRYRRNAITGELQYSGDSIAGNLPRACADATAHWLAIPRLTPSQYRNNRDELARRAAQLAVAAERFYMHRDPDSSEFSGLLDFTDLMTVDELNLFNRAIRSVTYQVANRALSRAGQALALREDYEAFGAPRQQAESLGYSPRDVKSPAVQDHCLVWDLLIPDHTHPDPSYGGVPTIPDLLRRLAAQLSADALSPPTKNPNLANGERNHFARALCKFFWRSYGLVSPSIVRDIVSIFFEQSITENDVSQMAAKVKVDFPLG